MASPQLQDTVSLAEMETGPDQQKPLLFSAIPLCAGGLETWVGVGPEPSRPPCLCLNLPWESMT